MEKKNYAVRIIPSIKKVAGEDGEKLVPKYKRFSNPNEKAKAKGFKPTSFFHLEVYEKNEANPLGGDTKPYTLIIFENRESLLFDAISQLMEDKSNYTVLPTKRKPAVLNVPLPGLLRKVPCSPYYATLVGEDGVEKRLQQNRRDPAGNYIEEDVVLDYVAYFLFENEVSDDGDAVKRNMALKAISGNFVKGNAEVEHVEAKKVEAKEEVEEPEEPTE
jgi:hypothetical protein